MKGAHRKKSARRIGITGSPGTGKKTVGVELAKILGYEFVPLNDLAIKKGMGRWVKRPRMEKEFVVDSKKLSRQMIPTRNRIVAGHLLPYVMKRSSLDFIAILRTNPAVLKERYKPRKYTSAKTKENLTAEALDLISFDALRVFGRNKVSEFDTSHTKPATVAQAIVETIENKRERRYGICAWPLMHASRKRQIPS